MLGPQHATAMLAGLGDIRIYQFLPQDAPVDLAALQARYDRQSVGHSADHAEQWLNWIVFLYGGVDPVGFVQATLRSGKNALVAYVIFPAFWRQGIGREAVTALISYLFETTDTPAVLAEIDTRNAGSIALVRRLGFCQTATVENADHFKGTASHEKHYQLSRAEWPALSANQAVAFPKKL